MEMYAPFYRLPVNSKTPFGYAIAFCVELLGAIFTCCILISFVCFAIGSLWVIKSCVKDVTNDVPMLNVFEKSEANYKKQSERFGVIVQGLSVPKQLRIEQKSIEWDDVVRTFHDFDLNFRMVNEFSQIYEFIITTLFLWTLSTVATNLFLLQSELIYSTQLLNGIKTIFVAIWSFLVIFIVCVLGQTMTNQFDEFSVELSQCNWYAMPFQMQRMYAIFLVIAQQETHLQGYGNILCLCNTMKKVRFQRNDESIQLVFNLSIDLDNQRKFLLFYDASPLYLNFYTKRKQTELCVTLLPEKLVSQEHLSMFMKIIVSRIADDYTLFIKF